MKRYIFLIITLMSLAMASAQSAATYFPYPTPPESLAIGRPRANYMVEHFWDRVAWKTAYTAPARMEQSLRDFASFLPLAAPDTVRASVEKLIKESSKKPANFEKLMQMAEATFRSDTASLFSAEVYLPFARAAAAYKKFPAGLRERYARQVQVMESSTAGSVLPAIEAVRRDGSRFALNDTTAGAQSYVLIIERPSDIDGRFERVRFTANSAASELIEAGMLKPILVLAAAEDDESWWKSVENLPAQWSVGRLADAESWFDLRVSPSVYMMDPSMTVVSEWMPLSTLIVNCENLVRALKNSSK